MAEFGTVFIPEMAISYFEDNRWTEPNIVSSDSITLHPGAHVLHYSSTCFEGLKAFRQQDGSVKIFRMDKNIARFAQSSQLLGLPAIDKEATARMIVDLVAKYSNDVPQAPGSMYIRPTHFGTEPAIGKAATPSATACQYILLSPVGDYFSNGVNQALTLLIEEQGMRCAPHNGRIKSGGNYASALSPIMKARQEYQADQVLFCPDGDVQETGAANFLLIDGDEIITKALDDSFLHGVTRDSILTIARHIGMKVVEGQLTVSELMERAAKPQCEAVLSGTAAVLTPVGQLIHRGKYYPIGTGKPGPMSAKLRQRINDIQWGITEDQFGWLVDVN